MAHTLPELPYARTALAPHISENTLNFHHGKHHNAYVNNLNGLLEGHALANAPLADVVRRVGEVDAAKRTAVFNNAAQHFNHSFYWNSLRPVGGGGPAGSLLTALNAKFGSLDAFKAEFTKAAATHFGSGWAWLVKDAAGKLQVTGTHDAGCPLTDGQTPLLTCDVWEHAYYLDYQNLRPKYIESFWALCNWEFAQANFEG
jgi:Fe-Mn family superoxide dismutase